MGSAVFDADPPGTAHFWGSFWVPAIRGTEGAFRLPKMGRAWGIRAKNGSLFRPPKSAKNPGVESRISQLRGRGAFERDFDDFLTDPFLIQLPYSSPRFFGEAVWEVVCEIAWEAVREMFRPIFLQGLESGLGNCFELAECDATNRGAEKRR